ncbi:MAG: hypothetical protein LBR20_02200 [Propionibacteriaceae bacterium]|jgi:hypothetical protein|nr:hypothetical protein [Propionibacteriaceae bacterium]
MTFERAMEILTIIHVRSAVEIYTEDDFWPGHCPEYGQYDVEKLVAAMLRVGGPYPSQEEINEADRIFTERAGREEAGDDD